MSAVAAVSASPANSAPPASSGGGAPRRGRKKKQSQAQQPPQHSHNLSNTDSTPAADTSAASPTNAAPFISPARPARAATPPATAPPASKPDLGHLVGRPLVPFFLDDGAENTAREVAGGGDGREWGVSEDGRGVAVRQFVDGYFVDVGTIGAQQSQPQHGTPRTAPAKNGGKGGRGKGKASAAPAPATAAPGAAPVSYSAALQQGPPPSAKRALHPAPTPAAPSTPVPAAPPAKYGAPAFNNSPSPMKVPLPKFLKDKPASVPAISEENGSYVRGPSLMHLLQQSTEAEEASARDADSVSNGHGSFAPISLMHLLQPQPEPVVSAAHDASLLHSATSVPFTSFTPQFIPPHSIDAATPAASLPATAGDVPLSMPKLLFLRQSSTDEANTVVTAVSLDSPHAAATFPAPAASLHHATVNGVYSQPPVSFPLHNGAAATSYPLPSPSQPLPIYSTATSASAAAVTSAPSAC